MNTNNKKELSLVELAIQYLKDLPNPEDFKKIAEYCFKCINKDINDYEALSKFYTELTIDGRFIVFKDNKWDLKSKHKYQNITEMENYFQT